MQLQGPIGMEATTMITELIRDNRKVIDRIPREEIDRIVMLVKQHKVIYMYTGAIKSVNEKTFLREPQFCVQY